MSKFEKIVTPGKLFRVTPKNNLGNGLWYDSKGNYTGIIKSDFVKAQSADLPMHVDPVFRHENGVWISCTDSIENLKNWFSASDLKQLVEKDFELIFLDVSSYGRVFLDYKEMNLQHEVFRIEDVKNIETLNPNLIWEKF